MMNAKIYKLYYKVIEYLYIISSWLRCFDERSLLNKLEKVDCLDNRVRNTLVVIPFRDKSEMTIDCVSSLLSNTSNLESIFLCLVNNLSSHQELAIVQNYLKDIEVQNVDLINFNEDFNFSRICNHAVSANRHVDFNYILILNNDIKVHSRDLMWRMLGLVEAGAGIVGCKLKYPNQKIQHLFVSPGVKIVGAHPYKGRQISNLVGSFKVPAVTGACMLLSKEVFDQVGGFDEALPTHGQDLDLCLKVQSLGRDIVSIFDCDVTHYESVSRKHVNASFEEVFYIYNKWNRYLIDNPLYPKDFSRWSERPILRCESRLYPWWRFFGRSEP